MTLRLRMASRQAALAVLALLLVAGCASYGNKPFRLGEGAKIDTPDYTLRFVEADDEGWLWSPQQARDTIETVKDSAAKVDTYVVLFVHGWHHSARCCDDNVEGFKETLTRLHDQLLKIYPKTTLPGTSAAQPDNFRLVGIFVAWRGASLPGFLDYVTFWGRKSAAQRTGEVDLREFLNRLNQTYRTHNDAAASPTAPGGANTFLGLVTIGHSFGGQVLLRSVSSALEQELQSVAPTPGYLRDESPANPQVLQRPLHGFGDLVVLVNPAVESAEYQRLRKLSQQLTYPTSQTPVMLTVSAQNDVPRRWPFRWGRIVGEWFTNKPYNENPNERESERQALGIYAQNGLQITHQLQPLDPHASLKVTKKTHTPEPFCAQAGTCECDWLEWVNPLPPIKPDTLSWDMRVSANPNSPGAIPNLDRYDFSQQTIFENVSLDPLPGATPFNPFIVANTSPAIIDGHSGIFTTPFIDFLTQYIGFIEGKEYLLKVEGRPSKHSPRQATP